jgi:hypothetical protein
MSIFIMALEPLDTRYTGQWYEGIPKAIKEQAQSIGLRVGPLAPGEEPGPDRIEVFNIGGTQTSATVTEGAFLNFTATNIWKNSQINTLAQYFSNGTVKPGDKILFTDAWHSGILQVKYMSELTDIPVEIHSMWHAGSYDPQDFLGRKIKDKNWTYNAERSFFHASDFNYFATEFHRDLLLRVLFNVAEDEEHADGSVTIYDPEFRSDLLAKCVISGQPHNALVEALKPFKGLTKRNLVLFPHRVAPEKQPEIFRDLADHMPDVEFVVCQEQNLTKDEYHRMLGEAKVVFSANLQETLGISAMEGILVDTIPMLPDRLSYSEMYLDSYKYPSRWTTSWFDYVENRDHVIRWLRNALDGVSQSDMEEQRSILLRDYLNAGPMINKLLS